MKRNYKIVSNLLLASNLFFFAACHSNGDQETKTEQSISTEQTVSGSENRLGRFKTMDMDFSGPKYDAYMNELMAGKDLKVTNKNTSGGDCETAMTRIEDPASKSAVFISKSNCGDYGRSHEHIYTEGDEIQAVRTWDLAHDGETGSTFTETIIDFTTNPIAVKSREKVIKEHAANYDFKTETFKPSPGNHEELRKQYSDMLEETKKALSGQPPMQG